ncbi:MAG: phosphohydrolase [Bacteroidota bacterium]
MDFKQAKEFILAKQAKELPAHLTYHNIAHIQDVYAAAGRHIAAVGIKDDAAILLQTAALFHDSGFIEQAAGHEEISCNFAKQYLPGFGYSDDHIAVICGMIRATKIPQQPQTPLEEILADADLDYLGRNDFWEISDKLFAELKHTGVVDSEESWNQMQVRFFESHHYFTAYAKAYRETKKQENLQRIKNKLITL